MRGTNEIDAEGSDRERSSLRLAKNAMDISCYESNVAGSELESDIHETSGLKYQVKLLATKL